ncbi:MAG: ABC transporter permease [Candidatus Zixiibacteriota bacterium]
MHRIRFIAQKELYHILRDFRSLIIVIIMPVMMIFLYGYAINMDIERVTLAVVDFDHTVESRQFTERFYRSDYFSRPDRAADLSDPDRLLRSGEAAAILYIPAGFGQALTRNEDFEVGMTVDGSDASLASAVQAYSNGVLVEFMRDRLPPGFEIPGVTISQQVLYNPDLKSSHFLVPGLVAVILMMISALMTSMTIAREKESGTMEQLLTTPVKPREILIGKLLPYVVIAFLDGILVILFARVVFGVPFVGSQTLLLFFGLIYVTTALSIGILISSIAKTLQEATMLAQIATMLPSVMLSGFIFAIKNMPFVLQALSNLVAAKFFVTIIRGIMLKGAAFTVLVPQAVALILLMLVLMTVAARKFKTRVG